MMLGTTTHVKDRRAKLMEMLERLRDETYARVREFRRQQEQDAEPMPADEMDVARTTADVETHASLIEQAEQRLQRIDEAIARADAGEYGRCADCGETIPIQRMTALPFAICCVDCQQERNHAHRFMGEGTMSAPYNRTWTAPDEMAPEPEREYTVERAKRRRERSLKTSPKLNIIRPGRPPGAPGKPGRPKKQSGGNSHR